MKLLSSLLLFVILGAYPLSAKGQVARGWIKIVPVGEHFQIRMPRRPTIESTNNSYGAFTATGRLYSSHSNGITYAVWSLTTGRVPSIQASEISTDLNGYADLVWESLLKPIRDVLPIDEQSTARMSCISDLSMGPVPGREYSLKLGDAVGVVRLYMDGSRLYILLGLNAGASSARMRAFFGGFRVKPPIRLRSLPVAATLVADPMLIPPDARTLAYSKLPDDRSSNATPQGYDRIFVAKETTHPARILAKPEPQYTDAARSNQVSGTVVLRVILSKEGLVESIRVVSGLPHGLTQAAIAAARQLSFTPATKDGHVVSQFAGLEYNFNPY